MFKKTNLKKVTKKVTQRPSGEKPLPKTDKSLEKNAKILTAVKLRTKGMEWHDIGQQFDPPMPARGVRNMVAAHLKREADDATEEYKRFALKRATALFESAFAEATKTHDEDGNPLPFKLRAGAHKAAIEANKELCELEGLYAPVEIRHTDMVNEVLDIVKSIVSDAQYNQVLARLAKLSSEATLGGTAPERDSAPSVGLPN